MNIVYAIIHNKDMYTMCIEQNEHKKKRGKSMLSQDVEKLERENILLRQMIQNVQRKLEEKEILKPNSCQYCKKYVQYYIKNSWSNKGEYVPIYAGHCTAGVPVNKGGKKRPTPDDSCPYFELGFSN